MLKLTILLLLVLPVSAIAQHTQQPGERRPQPQAQALKVYTVIRDQDWRSLYFLTAVSPPIKKLMPTSPEVYAIQLQQGLEQGPDKGERTKRFLASISGINVGVPIIKGDKAQVPTSATVTFTGTPQVFKGVAHLIKDDGVWKLDLTEANNLEDLQKVTTQQVAALIGKP